MYLSLEEVLALDDNCNQRLIQDKIVLRKQGERRNRLLWNQIATEVTSVGETVLTGVSGSVGKAMGEACIINDVSEFSKLKLGQVLVCKYTDPIWTPLFSVASAVIAETGGALSHAAIVAREYGIPTVMGCGNATDILKDGQKVVVDGFNGKVELIS